MNNNRQNNNLNNMHQLATYIDVVQNYCRLSHYLEKFINPAVQRVTLTRKVVDWQSM